MIDKQLIEKKLRKIEEYLNELKGAKIDSFDTFKVDTIVKRFVERNLELSVEQMIDICKHFISGLDLKEPETYAECFDILSASQIIPDEDVNTFKTMVRFRNILIHVYDNIDDSITYGVYEKHLEDFRSFVKSIRLYCRQAVTKLNPG